MKISMGEKIKSKVAVLCTPRVDLFMNNFIIKIIRTHAQQGIGSS